ncbi:isoprenylcysteine carboxyl methyltransferase family protein [Paracerasibacillus soli]|uniref:Isoprenylcysteine carboxylmethyltransferase family protein n=1 Tax=Paracerasibacillus soli TaxID=480284 RepID=A0ABU5CS87_9BACI|nr:isoprenylcysteine carboxylmethyltransferase family protein [Virgibacillus soli]MDY0408278.1 isoprenylcysteine carboxylmethyltransferase family protein [Virgibacillus soli]
MKTWIWLFILFIIGQRLVELVIAKRNEKWMMARGGIIKGENHYKWFIILHTLFFIFIVGEVYVFQRSVMLNYLLLLIFVMTQLARVWCITTLGKFWNTKIIVLPRVALIKKGPYKYVKHPNYIIVGIELFIIPLLFGHILPLYFFLCYIYYY